MSQEALRGAAGDAPKKKKGRRLAASALLALLEIALWERAGGWLDGDPGGFVGPGLEDFLDIRDVFERFTSLGWRVVG